MSIARFKRAVRAWQLRLGLSDWTIEAASEHDAAHAAYRVSFNCSSRKAKVFMNGVPQEGVRVEMSPEKGACHECLHVLLGDLVDIAATRGSYDHEDVRREEHRVIERLLNAFKPGG